MLMSKNELSVEITQEKDTAVLQLLDSLKAELDFLRDLSIEDRKGLSKMGRKNVDLVERGYSHAVTRPQYLPSYISLEEYKKDIDLFTWLRKVEKELNLLSDKIKDTAILAEAEAYQTSRLYYNSVKAAAKAGDKEAEPIARDMAIHYKKKGASEEEPPQQTELQPQKQFQQ